MHLIHRVQCVLALSWSLKDDRSTLGPVKWEGEKNIFSPTHITRRGNHQPSTLALPWSLWLFTFIPCGTSTRASSPSWWTIPHLSGRCRLVEARSWICQKCSMHIFLNICFHSHLFPQQPVCQNCFLQMCLSSPQFCIQQTSNDMGRKRPSLIAEKWLQQFANITDLDSLGPYCAPTRWLATEGDLSFLFFFCSWSAVVRIGSFGWNQLALFHDRWDSSREVHAVIYLCSGRNCANMCVWVGTKPGCDAWAQFI